MDSASDSGVGQKAQFEVFDQGFRHLYRNVEEERSWAGSISDAWLDLYRSAQILFGGAHPRGDDSIL